MDYGNKAKELFCNGYNCSQAVLGAFCGETGLRKETAFAIASGFGGGIGRLREVCGAVSGMIMAAGLIKGGYEPKDSTAKSERYELIRELAGEFEAKNGSIICRELLNTEEKGGAPAERTDEYYKKRPCAELVEIAANILAEKLGL